MQHAPTTLTDAPANGVTGGIDWARDDHAVAVVDTAGRQIKRFGVARSDAGLRELVAGLASAGVAEIAIERPEGPVVDALLAAGLTVVVISPHQLKNLRGRYGSAGNKDDRFDAYVLADTLRTDRARLRPLVPDSPPTIALRAVCRARKDLVEHRVALANQLRAHLQRVFPGAVGLFAELDSPISLRFLGRFDCQDRADWLSAKRLGAWLRSVGYWDASRVEHLLASSFAALLSGGWWVDHDSHVDADKRGPLPVAEYSVLLMHSTPGKCWSVGELDEIARHVGFTDLTHRPTAGDRSIVVAHKPL